MRETLKLALEALEKWDARGRLRVITAIKQALARPAPDLTEQQRESYQKGHNDGVAHHKQAVNAAQPEQEPVIDCPFCLHSFRLRDVYTTPPKELNK